MPMNEHRFQVPDMSCEHCERAIKHELMEINGVWGVEVNLETKTVVVKHDRVVDTSAMHRAINRAGYKIAG